MLEHIQSDDQAVAARLGGIREQRVGSDPAAPFTLGIEAWQYFLPSRVADVNDVIWNTCGTIAGALLGHARLRLRFDFE